MKQNIQITPKHNGTYIIESQNGIYTLSPTKHQGNKVYAPYYLARLKPEYEYISGMYEKKEKNKHYFQGQYKGMVVIIDVGTSIIESRPLRQTLNSALSR